MSLQSHAIDSIGYEQARERCCARSGCYDAGVFLGPSTDDSSRAWLCLKHARDANSAWNYYEHKSDEEIEAAIRSSAVGYRPTWPISPFSNELRKRDISAERVREAFATTFSEIFGEKFNGTNDTRPSEASHSDRAIACYPRNREERDACQLLSLQPPLDTEKLKTRYRELAKAHHPDRHLARGADKRTRQQEQEHLKKINIAYSLLEKLCADGRKGNCRKNGKQE